MPRKAIDYSKSLVYRIAYKDMTYYVGSTTNFRNRKSNHKSNCKNVKSEDHNKALYVFIRENGGWSDDWVMILVQEYPNCKTSLELYKYEREHYDIYKPEFNVIKPCLKEGEKEEYQKEYIRQYRVDNADKIKQYKNQYNVENADKIKEKNKEYRVENADKIKDYKKENDDKMKEYHKVYNKVYRKENAEKFKEKHPCECGSIHSKIDISQHRKTKKHIKFIESQKNEEILTL